MYNKVSTDLNFVSRELEVVDFWKKNEIFKKAQAQDEGKPEFTFYDGPPTANGKPHIGHILTRCIKDLFPRYKAMKGYNVLRKAGWDTHGLPVELEVEKLLGLDGKDQIEKYGVEDFIKKCKESVWKYKSEWEDMSERVGYWADMENPYITYENNYIESEWWSLKKLFDKGLLYKGHKIVPYCPRCGTALSSHEVAQGYKDVKERSATVRFRLTDEDASVLAWTTTPWTLPSNVCLCVNANVTYCRAKKDAETYILAEELVKNILGEEAQIIDTFPGSALVGRSYKPLFECTAKMVEGKGKAFLIVADDYVTTTDGTGIVHNAPAFGEDDARVCKANGMAFIQPVNTKGELCGGTPWDGMFVKDADKEILKDLEEAGLLFAAPKFEHSYPHCWRCNTPLIYYARASWFVQMTKLHDELMKNNASINWLPENIKDGRMGNFLDNVIDWGISRERYWGTPLPIWVCECGHKHCIGSIEELKSMSDNCPDNIELHKPYIDAVTIKCPVCGKQMKRVSEVIDCWYDSGSMPFAQWHYPFENEDKFKKRYPANFISEAVDQTRGWFYTLIAISTAIFGRAPFENCIVLGHVQDKDGKKMSKHIGNVVDPWSVLDNQGADAVRWYFYSNSAPWLPNRFYGEAVSEAQRKFIGTLWNTYAFYILYAEIDKFNPTEHKLSGDLCTMDKWIISRLNSTVKAVTEDLDAYHITEATKELSRFVDELSNWYVRRSRDRFWGSEMTKDKEDAYMTLYTVLETFARLCAPFIPFMTETMYQNIVRSVDKNAPESIHLTDYPVCDEAKIDSELEEDMKNVLGIVMLGRACRNEANIKNRQPIGKLFVGGVEHLPENLAQIIRGELNVKEVGMGAAAEEFITYNVKPQLKTLGPKYGKLLGAIRSHLMNADGSLIVNAVRNGGVYTFEADGNKIELGEADLLIEPKEKEGYAVMTEGALAVIIDTELTDELIEEGKLREMVSKIQTMRKEAGFEVTDHIRLGVANCPEVEAIAKKYEERIKKEVLADELAVGSLRGYEKNWDINGDKADMSVEKV